MGQMMAYLLTEGKDRAPHLCFEAMETRGGGAVWLSAGFLAVSLMRLWLARKGGVVLHVNVAERASIFRKGILVLAGRAWGIPSILHLHAAELTTPQGRLGYLGRKFAFHMFHRADRVVVLGKKWKDFLADQFDLPKDRISILSNGVPDYGLRNSPGHLLPEELVFVGNLLPRKGLNDLLQALSSPLLKDKAWRLSVIGSGNAAALYREAEAVGVGPRVRFLGWQNRLSVIAHMRNAAAVILPSHAEALPLVVLEALSLGVPVITTEVGAIPDWLTDHKNALLVPPHAPLRLAKAIAEILTDPQMAAEIGRAGRDIYDCEFRLEIFIANLTGIYRDVVEARDVK
jgi:glycosyltransferase involved in cell wall biosynthesis